MQINELVTQIESIQANQELMIYRHSDGNWEVHIGNPSEHVLLGEVAGLVKGEGPSLQDALLDSLKKLTGDVSC